MYIARVTVGAISGAKSVEGEFDSNPTSHNGRSYPAAPPEHRRLTALWAVLGCATPRTVLGDSVLAMARPTAPRRAAPRRAAECLVRVPQGRKGCGGAGRTFCVHVLDSEDHLRSKELGRVNTAEQRGRLSAITRAARPGQARPGQARQGKARQGKARQGKASMQPFRRVGKRCDVEVSTLSIR